MKKHMPRKRNKVEKNFLEMKECLGIKESKDEAKKECDRE
jgi:hypothetical protein